MIRKKGRTRRDDGIKKGVRRGRRGEEVSKMRDEEGDIIKDTKVEQKKKRRINRRWKREIIRRRVEQRGKKEKK